MMKFAADLSMLWTGLPYADRFDAAAAAGFAGVVVPFPYDVPAKETQRALLRNGLTLVMISAPPPNYTGGARGFAAVPGAGQRFAHDLRRALRYCEALRVPALRLLGGPAEGPEAAATLRENLRMAVGQMPAYITLLLGPEPGPDAFLQTTGQVAQLISELDHPALCADWYISGAEAGWQDDLRAHAGLIRQVTLSAPPDAGRERGGGIPVKTLVETLDQVGYSGWIVAGYNAPGPAEESLGWMSELS